MKNIDNLSYRNLDAIELSERSASWSLCQQREFSGPEVFSDWLFDAGSLTERLKVFGGGSFDLTLLEETWLSSDSLGLRGKFGPISVGHNFWSRKVCLSCFGKPVVMAHTLVPQHGLVGKLKEILTLKEKPLGEYLFQEKNLLRSTFEVINYENGLWGRRSLFFLHRKPVLVAEFFLPELLHLHLLQENN
jgi:chorismate--pyruvate lyase